MPRLTFDPLGHQYFLDGELMPSVTRILSDLNLTDYSSVPKDVLEAAALRGTYVHQAIQMDAEGDLDESTLDPGLLGYVSAYRKFRDEAMFTPQVCEKPVCDPVRCFAGTPDQVGLLGFVQTLCEFKSGKVMWWTALQTAAYASCLPELKITKRMAVQLNNDGTYRVFEYKDRDDIKLFYSAVALWHRKQRG